MIQCMDPNISFVCNVRSARRWQTRICCWPVRHALKTSYLLTNVYFRLAQSELSERTANRVVEKKQQYFEIRGNNKSDFILNSNVFR
ncbi:hypothetical protein PUN28_016513 [Cardiocondyla obscurior]|uniref:Uncharacterized protein n=1 Tax=Cardiocondyla obscurior TaxID=286306 RepID=A0AAW2ERN9_9HYME